MDALAMDLDTAEREVATEEVTEVHRSKAVSPEVDETLDLVVEIIAVEEAEGKQLTLIHSLILSGSRPGHSYIWFIWTKWNIWFPVIFLLFTSNWSNDWKLWALFLLWYLEYLV